MTVTATQLSDATSGVDTPCKNWPELWFSSNRSDIELAEAACANCDVLEMCRAYADAAREEFGVWGGKRRSGTLH